MKANCSPTQPLHGRRPWMLGLLLAGLLAAEAQAAEPLILVNAVYPPFVNSPGDPSGEGIDVDIAREALRRGGGDYEITVVLVGWKRALKQLEDGQADFTTTISKNENREKILDFTRTYRNSTGYAFFSRRGEGPRVQRLSDLNGVRLGISAGFFYPESITNQPGVRVETGKDLATSIRMLEVRRSDLIVVNAIAGPWEIRRLGLLDALEQQPLTYSSDSPTYMAFSKARANTAAFEAMQRGLNAMRSDGSLRRIEQKYLSLSAGTNKR